MAARHALWSGTLTFGLVSIPVALVAAVHSRRSHFRMLHETDHSPLRRRMYCPEHDTYVHPEHIVRGYQVEQDQFVVVRDSEIEAVEPKRSRSIEIDTFVDVAAIDPPYFRRPYYLVPTGSEKPYRLLVRTMRDSGKAGITQFVMHDREYLAAVASLDDSLCLQTLYYRDEVRATDDLASGKATRKLTQDMRKVIKEMADDFDPGEMRDIYQERIDKLIQRKKRKNETVELPDVEEEPEAAETAEGVDLIDALEASLAKTRGDS